MYWKINTTKQYKVWFSKDPSIFLGIEDQLRFIRTRIRNPLAQLSFIYSSKLLSDNAKMQLVIFCEKYHIKPVDFDYELPKLLERQQDKNLYAIAEQEINKSGGNLASASDCLRLIVPVMEYFGIYSDFDVTVNFSTKSTISVKAPVIIPTSFTKEGYPYINIDFLAVAYDEKNADKIAPEALANITIVQESVISHYKNSVLEAFFKSTLSNSQTLIQNDLVQATLVHNFCTANPSADIFALRKYASELKAGLILSIMGKNVLMMKNPLLVSKVNYCGSQLLLILAL